MKFRLFVLFSLISFSACTPQSGELELAEAVPTVASAAQAALPSPTSSTAEGYVPPPTPTPRPTQDPEEAEIESQVEHVEVISNDAYPSPTSLRNLNKDKYRDDTNSYELTVPDGWHLTPGGITVITNYTEGDVLSGRMKPSELIKIQIAVTQFPAGTFREWVDEQIEQAQEPPFGQPVIDIAEMEFKKRFGVSYIIGNPNFVPEDPAEGERASLDGGCGSFRVSHVMLTQSTAVSLSLCNYSAVNNPDVRAINESIQFLK